MANGGGSDAGIRAADSCRILLQRSREWFPNCTVKQCDLMKACFIVHRTHKNCLPTPPKCAFMRSYSSKTVSWVHIPTYSSCSNINRRYIYLGNICISDLKSLPCLIQVLVSETKSNHEWVNTLLFNSKWYFVNHLILGVASILPIWTDDCFEHKNK